MRCCGEHQQVMHTWVMQQDVSVHGGLPVGDPVTRGALQTRHWQQPLDAAAQQANAEQHIHQNGHQHHSTHCDAIHVKSRFR